MELRAIAVLSVLLFHLQVPGFGGGFVGVDVFFVISGYLICKLIKDGVDQGTFTFTSFYVRRARRLLPALFSTLVASFVFAFLLFAPEHFKHFGLSAAAAAVSLSNFYFWTHSNYFDLGAQFQPLLHTWSLGVEEQFYLFFPAFFVLTLFVRTPYAPALAIGIAGFISLALSISFLDGSSVLVAWSPLLSGLAKDGPSTVFYLPFFRIFEFSIGAFLIWLPRFPAQGTIYEDCLLAAALCLIGYSVVFFDKDMVFPGVSALPPCVGAALCVYAGRAHLLGSLLRNRLATGIGRISYSIYLVHWPAIIFYRYYVFEDLSVTERTAIFFVSVGLGYASYRFIEQPFRRPTNPPQSGAVLVRYALGAGCIAVLGCIVYGQNGWSGRTNENVQAIAEHRYAVGGAQVVDFMGSIGCKDLCEFGNLKSTKFILVAGDSHSDQYTKALSILAPDLRFKLIQSGSCFIGYQLRSRPRGVMTEICRAALREMTEWLKNPNVVAVIHSQRWPGYIEGLETWTGAPLEFPSLKTLYEAEIADVLKLYQGFTGNVVFVNASPTTNLSCLLRPRFLSRRCPLPSLVEQTTFASLMRAAVLHLPNRSFVDPADTICPSGTCQVASGDGEPLYSDEDHLTVTGAKLIVPKILNALHLTWTQKP